MRIPRKLGGAVAGALASATLAAGVSTGLAGSVQAAAPVTLHVLYMNQAGYTPAVVGKIVDQFNATHPGIHVIATYLPYNNMHDAITTSAAAPKATYNVVLSDLIWTAEFEARGYTIPLNPYLGNLPNTNAIPKAVWGGFTIDGKIMAMPFLVNFQNFYYNKKILKEAGFSGPPRSIAQWINQMETIKAKHILKYPFEDSWSEAEGLTCDYVRFAQMYGGPLFVNGKPAMNRGAGLKALELMRFLYAKGLASPESLQADDTQRGTVFNAGQTAFDMDWTNETGLMNNPSTSSIVGQGAVGLFPTWNGKGTASVSGYQGLAITANTPVSLREDAWKFIQFATSPRIIGQHLQSQWPIWTSIANSARERQILGAQNVKVYEANLAAVQNRPMVPNYLQVSAIIQQYVREAISGQLPVKQAADEMVAQINALPKVP